MGRPAVAAQRREQILDGLFAAIAKKGFIRCSISDVARESGLARGALHYYFNSKEQMLVELMTTLGKKHLEALRNYRGRFSDPLDRIMSIFRFHFSPENDQAKDRARVWIEYWGYGLACPQVRGVIRDIQQAFRRDIEEDLLAGIANGRFRNVPTESTAVLILGLVEGPMLQKTYDPTCIQGNLIVTSTRSMLEASLH